MFEKATRLKIRFESAQGGLSVEDLWDLPLTSQRGQANLDKLAISLHHQIQAYSAPVSFVDETKSSEMELVQLKFDIVKHIIGVRKTENAAALESRNRAQLKEQLTDILAKKRGQALENLSEEELQTKIAAL